MAKVNLSEVIENYEIHKTVYTTGIIKYQAIYKKSVLSEFSASLYDYNNEESLDDMAKFVLFQEIKKKYNLWDFY